MLGSSHARAEDAKVAQPKVADLSIKGTIEGSNITLSLEFEVETFATGQEISLAGGDIVLDDLDAPKDGAKLRYDSQDHFYYVMFPAQGKRHVAATFAARATAVSGGALREASFEVPASWKRQLQIITDRTDLEVQFPGAMGLERESKDGKLTITAVMGPGRPFSVRWKPQLAELDAKLVLASQSNTIATAGGGALRLDTLLNFKVSQGKLSELAFTLPKGLSVTQVRGEHIRDWKIEEPSPADATRRLVVALNRPQTAQYALQILAEMPLPKFPTDIDLPLIQPEGGIRNGGSLAVGTDSAIQLLIKKSAGLSQIDAANFPRAVLNATSARDLPPGKAFFYNYATGPYQMTLGLDDIVPSLDASHRMVVSVKEDDMIIEAGVEIDVRDAPVRNIVVDVPAGFLLAGVSGALVDDHTVRTTKSEKGSAGGQEVDVHFRQPVLGRTVVGLRLEMSKSPLDKPLKIQGLSVHGAKNERGYVVIATEPGVQVQTPTATKAREIHTGAVPMKIADAQFAYRFRDAAWSLDLSASKRASGIRVEAFQLLSLGDGVAYGSVAVNYFISGSPVDELSFTVPAQLQNVEFIGRDVRRWTQDPKDASRWVVKLQRKVIGDYNLGVTYTQRYGTKDSAASDKVLVGGIDCSNVATQTGYIAVASHLDLKLAKGSTEAGLLEVDHDELPANYRLLVNAPLLRTYKYVSAPHTATLEVGSYERGSLLPVVIEIMDVQTRITPTNHGPADSITTVRYKVKNSSSQFLALGIPKDAQVWQTWLLGRDANGNETAKRVPASFDKVKNLLLVPLERNRNPNDPITIAVELGQQHPALSGGRMTLVAPTSDVQSTFGQWTLQVDPAWSLFPASSTMVPEPRTIRHGSLAAAARGALGAWGEGIDAWSNSSQPLAAGVIAVVVIGLVLLVHWRAIVGVVLLLALLLAVWIGISAARGGAFQQAFVERDNLSMLSYTQAVSLDQQSPLSVEAVLVPAWRQHATWTGMYAAPVAALVCLVLAVPARRARWLLLALAFVLLVFAASQFAQFGPLLGNALTWGVPAVLALLAAWRLIVRPLLHRAANPPAPPTPEAPKAPPTPPAPPAAAVAAVILFAMLMLPSCAMAKPVFVEIPPLADSIVLDRVDANLIADKDSMKTHYHLKINASKPVRFPLVGEDAILLSPEPAAHELGLQVEGGKYYVLVRKKGVYDLELDFLSPLPEAGEDLSRQFKADLPQALTNRVSLTIQQKDLDVASTTAVRFNKSEADGATVAQAIFGQNDAIDFTWRPRDRQTRLEKTTFYSEIATAVRFDAGLIEARHRIRFQIAQGELKDIRIAVPAAMTVTSVEGAELGAWRFDPTAHELEAHLARGMSADYVMDVVTQIASDKLPFSASVGTLEVKDTARQRGTLGVLTSPAVFVTLGEHPQAMNVEDFARSAGGLIGSRPGYDAASLRHAFRIQKPDEKISIQVAEVLPEIRSSENAVFSVADDRLVYNAELNIDIAKAGVFGMDLKIPEGYDIDALAAAEVSHWDDSAVAGGRLVQIHFNKKMLGPVALKLALSKPVSDLPKRIDVPRVEPVGSIKHVGQVVINSDRGVRLSIANRKGVSELNPLEIGIREPGTLAFRLLNPQWELSLATEVVEPRVNVSFLHVAKISEGMVRHTHYLSYHLYNAGAKVFEVQVPKGVLGLLINGPDVARLEEVTKDSGRYRVELGSKWYDRPYPLTVRYETQFDRAAGKVSLEPVVAQNVDLQRGHVVVLTSERVELAPATVSASLQPAEARGIPREFGAGDLSEAALCYSVGTPDYSLTLTAQRHDAAPLLEANVDGVAIQTVVAEGGQSATRVEMQLRVLSKRHLETTLPQGSRVWSLLVNGRSTVPSKQTDASGREVLLIPLSQAASGGLPVQVDLVYVTPSVGAAVSRHERFEGPRFDLPLKDVQWTLYLPESFEYSKFDGTLRVNDDYVAAQPIQEYDTDRYEEQVIRAKNLDLKKAVEYQSRANVLVQQGANTAAKTALNNAYNYSFSDAALNEDARVQLQDLSRSQAVVGLVGSRGRLRQQGQVAGAQGAVQPNPGEQQAEGTDVGDRFNDADVQRIKSSLSKADSENLDLITQRLIAVQEEAAGPVFQLVVNMPLRGRVVAFNRPAQVEPNAEMFVGFNAEPVKAHASEGNWLWGSGLFVTVVVLTGAASLAGWRPKKKDE